MTEIAEMRQHIETLIERHEISVLNVCRRKHRQTKKPGRSQFQRSGPKSPTPQRCTRSAIYWAATKHTVT
jgi:hypothetical protein